MAKDVRFNIRLNIDGKESIVTASANTKELASQLGIVHDKVTATERAFAASMMEANTMAGKDAAGFKTLTAQVTELSKAVPVASDEL